MSYCRWSDTSDVYVIEDIRGGWTTYVVDGQIFYGDPTPGACADRLETLATQGFRVRPDVIDTLRAEQHEMEARP